MGRGYVSLLGLQRACCVSVQVGFVDLRISRCLFDTERGPSVCWQEEDEQEKFERMQEMTLPDCPGSVSFYRAKMRSDQKVISAWPGLPLALAESLTDTALARAF